MKKFDQKNPEGDKNRLILDNHSAHTSKETQEYLNGVPAGLDLCLRQPMAEYGGRLFQQNDKTDAVLHSGIVQRRTGGADIQIF